MAKGITYYCLVKDNRSESFELNKLESRDYESACEEIEDTIQDGFCTVMLLEEDHLSVIKRLIEEASK